MADPAGFRFEIECPHCGYKGMQIIGELVDRDEVPCGACGDTIDITNEKWKAGLRETIEGLREIYALRKR